MPSLFFPSQDVLRLALASGAVPADIAAAPARVAWTDQGGIWLAPARADRDLVSTLARLGVSAVGSEPTVVWFSIPFWALALPLRRAERATSDELILFEIAASSAGRFAAQLRRAGSPRLGFRIPADDELEHDRCWLMCVCSPLLLTRRDDAGPVCAFRQQSPRVWVECGHEHPAPDCLLVPEHRTLLLRGPRSWTLIDAIVPTVECTDYDFPHQPMVQVSRQREAPAVPTRFRLVETEAIAESLWLLDGAEAAGLVERTDSIVHRHFEAVEIHTHGKTSLLVRRCPGPRSALAFSGSGSAFSSHPRVPNLYLPIGRCLQPMLREAAIAKQFGCSPDRIVWLEADSGGALAWHSTAADRFRPLHDFVAYHRTPGVKFTARASFPDPFPFPRFAWKQERKPIESTRPAVEALHPIPVPLRPATPQPSWGWLGRALQHLVSGFLNAPPAGRPAAAVTSDLDSGAVESVRVGQKLSSPDTLLHGMGWPARRQELESRLLEEMPGSDPSERAERWAELAAVYGAVGNAPDAAICWMNAIWDAAAPPGSWLKQWILAESRVAKMPTPGDDIGNWLAEFGAKPGATRMLAAHSYAFASSNSPAAHSSLERHCEELPVRAAWLAISKLCDGDPLALARWRDRLLVRLREMGPGLDLDEPSFLRFHGTATAERFQQAREWLARAREPIRVWFRGTIRGGRLRDVGLEAETAGTAAYIDLLIAWGLGCVGERTKSQNGADRARAVLQRICDSRSHSQVHGMLLRMLLQRIREAQDGRLAKVIWPADLKADLERLPELDRYCVDRLRSNSRILEPSDHVNAFRGRDRRGLLGIDQLGERLQLLLDQGNTAAIADEARQLLEICVSSPASDTLPRIAFTLLELAPRLERAIVVESLAQVVPAIDWLEIWLQSQNRGDVGEDRLVPGLSHLIERSLNAAAAADLIEAGRTIADYLARRAATTDLTMRAAIVRCATSLFRSLLKLGLENQADAILRHIDGTAFHPERLGLAVGWFGLGRDDLGTRLLDEARDRLYLTGSRNDRKRTSLALAYADVLGAAPPRIALGRLEEIFQRLGPIAVHGSTNSYFTLQPLRLIDTVVRAVVGEDLTLGPRVQTWLEDDEFLIRQRIQRDMSQALREQGFQ